MREQDQTNRSAKEQGNDADVSGFSCPVPRGDYSEIILAHGGGGKLSSELVRDVFLNAFGNDSLHALADAAVLDVPSGRLAMSTDSYVVRPLFFPGGSIADLAINGTVNDLAMVGAKPLYLNVGFIIEEGFPIEQLQRIADEMSRAAREANVSIVSGDTKVVERGHGDGCYLNTSGVGVVPPGIDISPGAARPGDVVIVSGSVGDHGMAIMSVREGLEFESEIRSDSAPLAELVAEMIAVCPQIHTMRDPTRGGLAAVINEIAEASRCGIVIDEPSLPVKPEVASACEILGLDPMFVANEGKLVCFAPAEAAAELLSVMRAHQYGREAKVIGRVVDEHPGTVVATTALGASRVITVPVGEQLPRIC